MTAHQGNAAAATAERLLRIKEVLCITGLSKTHVYRLIEFGDFPRPVRISPKAVAWPDSEVQGWIAARMQAREA